MGRASFGFLQQTQAIPQTNWVGVCVWVGESLRLKGTKHVRKIITAQHKKHVAALNPKKAWSFTILVTIHMHADLNQTFQWILNTIYTVFRQKKS